MTFDLLVRGGRLVDPATGTDGPRDIAITGDRIAAIDSDIPSDRARRVIDAGGAIVTPGLIDMHSHVYWGGTPLGVDPDLIAAQSGTTTFVDAGSAGAGNFLGFRRHVIERSKVRIIAYLNISFGGIFGFSNKVMVGECGDLALLDPREAVACGRDHADMIVGVKVRSGRIAGGNSGIAPVDIAVEAADRLHLPVMAHIDEPPPGRLEVLSRMRQGDVLTHCCRPFPNSALLGNGHIRGDMFAARERGVLFDLGHGAGSFDFSVAQKMIAEGFVPDMISSDVHLFNIHGPAFDLLVCMSKMMALGLSLGDALRGATVGPAKAIGRPELGTLAVGGPADVAVLREKAGDCRFRDSTGALMQATRILVSDGIVAGGTWQANEAKTCDARDLSSGPSPHANHAAALAAHFGRPCCGGA
ncbi:amidohydrolase/deacetylase family metallohydrolase [Oceaniglobus trochenteri]|uniref:amidohydrolase/deacetylase family metallohydrolase n=1 Tax=Oceaniglobus trochenteri TaxID=2763260 RepID=UPI001CFF9242|nr:amidohydrolase/deacetylase family metallohydrolase [Oceaniglobus trochenteri]